jgi:hypothetical protein
VLARLQDAAEINAVKLQQAVQRIEAEIAVIDAFLGETNVVPAPAESVASVPDGTASSTAAAVPVPTAPSPAALCRFLRQAHRWEPEAAALASLPPPVSAAGVAEALQRLPREVGERTEALAQFPRLLSLLRVKDELLRFAVAGRKGLLVEQERHSQALARMHEASQAEMESWMKLSQRLQAEMAQWKQTCVFCGIALSGQSASTPCAANARPSAADASSLSHLASSDRHEGDGMHFFVAAP